MKKSIENIIETKRVLFEKNHKIDKTLDRLIRKKRERTQINKIKMKREKLQQTSQKYNGS